MTAPIVRGGWRGRLVRPLLGLLALNVATYAAYTLPRTHRERSIAARREVLRLEVAQQRARAEALRRRTEAMRTNAADVDRFYARLGAKGSLLDVQREIAGIARELGVQAGSRSYINSVVKGGDRLGRFEIKMVVAGTYSQLASFLDRIERSSLFLTVDQVGLRARSGGGQIELDVSLSAYFRISPEAPERES